MDAILHCIKTKLFCAIPAYIRRCAIRFILLIISPFFSLHLSAQQPVPKHQEAMPGGLYKAWSDFVTAIKAKDEKRLRTITTPCVYCVNCLENTAEEYSAQEKFKETHPRSWYRLMYGKQSYIPAGKFIADDLPIIFDKETISRLTDSAKLMFYNDSVNKRLYEKSCIAKRGDRRSIECYEVFVKVVDPSAATEGLQKAFEFMRIDGRYLFCGYSTIP